MNCQELLGAAKSCHALPGITRSCQELPGAAKSCEELPGNRSRIRFIFLKVKEAQVFEL